jgi:hypothetical protein
MSQQFIHLNTKHFVFLDLCAYITITIQLFAWRNLGRYTVWRNYNTEQFGIYIPMFRAPIS